ncbi:MAG TPA: NAD(P)/FAD-dependent oxidoreductase, partial [Nitrosospira sp.]|nr:NAD(P)/FAD-dependent oxidoreductase [Nitrosospira sp.]
EQSPALGGTWWDNIYPGAECDVRAHLYSYSFAPNPEWSQAYAPQGEIHQYLERCAARFDLFPRIRFNTVIREARFDVERGIWRLRLENGGNGEQLETRFFVCSTGPLSHPRYPDIPGMDAYRGALLHSARWDRAFEARGKHLAVIGTAASAVQLVPRLAPLAEKLYVCQRSPNWIIPRINHVYAPWEKALFRVKFISGAHRFLLYAAHEANRLSFNPGSFNAWIAHRLAEWHLRRQVPDGRLRQALRPGYPFGCKRVLLSNDYYPALMRSNVELVTAPISKIDQRGIITKDGQRREVDAIVCATGFDISYVLSSVRIEGSGGRVLGEAWAGEPDAYRGVAVAGFPNLFLLLGPNTGQGHTSAMLFIEAQVNHALQCIQEVIDQGKVSMEVKQDAMARYNVQLQKKLAASVWAAGCRSWYKAESGKIVGIYPGFSFQYARELKTPRFEDYIIR